MIIPLSLLVLVLVAYVALYVAGVSGRPATGPRVAMRYETCPDAKASLEARAAAMGLGDVRVESTESGVVVRAQLPDDASVAAAIPETLAKTGALDILDAAGSAVVAAGHVEETSIHMGTKGAQTLVQLDPEATESLRRHMQDHGDGRIAVCLDGVRLFERKNLPVEPRGRLELNAPGTTEAAQVRVAAEWSVIIGSGPLPCPARLVETVPLP